MRDPRLKPRVGDVLHDGNSKLTVTEADTKSVRYSLVTLAPRSALDRAPMRCKATMKQWRSAIATAEVIHAAD